MEEGESATDSKLTERIQKLRQWQEKQRTRLLEQQRQQYESLRQEQEKIHQMLTTQKSLTARPQDSWTNIEKLPIPVSNVDSSPRPPSSLSDSPRSPGIVTASPVIMGQGSPSERIERTAQLRQLLQEARMEQALFTTALDQPASDDSDTAASEVDGVCPLPESASSECHDSESENKAAGQEVVLKWHQQPRMAKMYSGIPAVPPSNPRKKTVESQKQVAYDERPIIPGVGSQVKNFEEFVEMQLQACDAVCEDQTNAKGDMPTSPPQEVKHRFLRKGEGLMRFNLINNKTPEQSPSNSSTPTSSKQTKPRSARRRGPEMKTAFHYHLKPRLTLPEKKKNVNRKITSCKRTPVRDVRMKSFPLRHLNLPKSGNIFKGTRAINMNSAESNVAANIINSIYNPMQQSHLSRVQSLGCPLNHPVEGFSQNAIGIAQKEKLTEFQRNLCTLAAVNSNNQNSTPEAIVRRLKNLNLKWNDDSTRDHFLSSPERSFLLRVEELEKKKEKDEDDLVEFEILERAAEETSFCSTSSIVVRALQWRTVQVSPRNSPKRCAPRLALVAEQVDDVPCSNEHHLLKSCQVTAEDPACIESVILVCTDDGTSAQPDTKTEQNEVESTNALVLSNDENQQIAEVTEVSMPEDIESDTSSAIRDSGQLMPSLSDNKLQATTDLQSIPEDSVDVSTLDISLDHETTLHRSSSSEGFEFQDNESWVDNDDSTTSGGASPLQPVKRSPRSHRQSPASAFVARYFPVLQQKICRVKETVPSPNASQPITAENETLSQVNPVLLWEKMNQLEQEVERFRSLSSTLEELNQQHKHAVEKLKKDSADFDKYKHSEMLKLENSLEEEKKKLRRERQLCDQFLKSRAQAERRDKEEVQSLKKQVEDLRGELKRKESRWSSTNSRLQERLRSVETENADLRREVQELAKQRLQSWQKVKKKPTVASAKFASPPFADTIPSSVSPTATPVVNGPHSPPLCPGNISQLSPPEKDTSMLAERKSPKPVSVEASKKTSTDAGQNMGQLRPLGALRPGTESNEGNENPYQFDPGTSLVDKDDKSVDEIRHKDGTIERVYGNGTHKIFYPNGTRKEISSDGQSVMVFFFNGDIKHTLPDGRCIYYFAANKTTHTTYPDGLQVYHFRNNQLEKHYPDGTKEIVFANQSIKLLFPDGSEETNLVDGTIIRSVPDGNRIVQFPNGQKEIHTKEYKKREYPDGTVKYLFSDGRQETRYANGRVRIKDKDGTLTLDSKYPGPSQLRK